MISASALSIAPAFAQPAPAAQASALNLTITFPARSDTFALEKVRISGSTDPAASVWVNDKPVRVYPQGAFVSRVALQTGMNQIPIRAEKKGKRAEDVLSIYRPPDLASSPEIPTVIDTSLIYPREDIWLLPGDFLQVRFKGSPGGTATFWVEKQQKGAPMVELEPENADGLRGIYSGLLRLSAAEPNRPYGITAELRGTDGRRAKIELPGRLYLLPYEVPLIGRVRDETNLWNAAAGGAPIGMLQDSVRLWITGKYASRYKVRLSANQIAYVNTVDVSVLPLGTQLPLTAVSAPGIAVEKEWYVLTMNVEMPVPYLVQQTVDPPALDLYLYGAYQGAQWITYPSNSMAIKRVLWSQPEENVLRIHVDLDQKQQWGYRVVYKGKKLIWYIRKPPQIGALPDSPVKGLRFAVDAGHGGDETGGISPTGINEKDVNLAYAGFLVELLRQAGAEVVMTRTEDRTMTLRERVEIARQTDAQIFLWLHNNSVGPGSDAAAARGTSTYFTVPQNQELAWTVYPHLLRLGLSSFGRIFNSYYVTRTTDMLVLLVEGAFLSSPDDEQLLANDEFLRRLAKAIFAGVEEFLAKQG